MPGQEFSDFGHVQFEPIQVAVGTTGDHQHFGTWVGSGKLLQTLNGDNLIGVAVDEHQGCPDEADSVTWGKVVELMTNHALHRLE